MKITKDTSYTTRVFDIKDDNIFATTYTVTYTETFSGWEWHIQDHNHKQIDEESDLGLELLGICVTEMGIEN
jgi:hypothetical protein